MGGEARPGIPLIQAGNVEASSAQYCGVHAMNGKDGLVEIDADGDNIHGLPLPVNE